MGGLFLLWGSGQPLARNWLHILSNFSGSASASCVFRGNHLKVAMLQAKLGISRAQRQISGSCCAGQKTTTNTESDARMTDSGNKCAQPLVAILLEG